MLIIVAIKLIEPNKELIPAKCNANIPKSIDGPLLLIIPDKGGYKVQPVPIPTSVKVERINNKLAGGNNQKLILFNLGNAISIAPINIGTK